MSSSPLSRAHLCHYLVTSCCNYNCSCITLTAGGCSPGGPCRFINIWPNEALAASPSWSLHLHLVQNSQNAWGLGQGLLPFSPQVTFSTPVALSHSFTLTTAHLGLSSPDLPSELHTQVPTGLLALSTHTRHRQLLCTVPEREHLTLTPVPIPGLLTLENYHDRLHTTLPEADPYGQPLRQPYSSLCALPASPALDPQPGPGHHDSCLDL